MRSLLALCAVSVLAGVASAQTIGVQSFAGGTQFSSFDSNGDTVGWYFTANSGIQVTHLGFWDASQNGLTGSHQVGIFRVSDQALLGSVTVQAGTASPLDGQWRYEALGSAVTLTAGAEYVLGAYYHPAAAALIDNYISGANTIITAPEITINNNAVDANVGAGPFPFTFPATRGAATGRFGPNMKFVIPAPGSLALLGIAGLATNRRRR